MLATAAIAAEPKQASATVNHHLEFESEGVAPVARALLQAYPTFMSSSLSSESGSASGPWLLIRLLVWVLVQSRPINNLAHAILFAEL